MRRSNLIHIFGLFALLVVSASSGSAGSVSFQGNFTTDDQQLIFSFVAGPGNAVIQTWGFAGGTNAASQLIAAGGFDPILSLFGPGLSLQSSSPLLATIDNGGASVPADPGSGEHFDSFIDTGAAPTIVALIPGQTYFVVLTESDNAPLSNTYGGGFSEDGQGNFTQVLYPCGPGPFCDIDFDQRNSHWAVDITGVASAQIVGTPEPGAFWLVGGALGCSLIFVRRRKQLTAMQYR